MKRIIIKLDDKSISYGTVYSGSLHSWFPELEKFRVKEYTNFVNGFVAISKELSTMNLKDNFLLNLLSTYASLSLFTDAEVRSEPLFYFNLNSSDTSITSAVTKIRNLFLKSIKDNGDDYSIIIDRFYSGLLSYSKAQLEKKKTELKIEFSYKNKKLFYPELEKLVLLAYDSNRFSQFNCEKIAGNTQAKISLMSAMDRLLCYNVESKNNPLLDIIDFSKVITLLGASGTGKSMLISQALDYINKKSYELNKPFVFLSVDADTRSEFRSISERQLKKKFDLAYFGDAIYALLVDEIDTKIFSRESITANNSPELSFTGTFLECLNGMNNYLGNFVVLVTSNRQINADPALKRRLMENVIFVNGLETIKDYITVFKNKLRKGLDLGYVKIKDWDKIGSISQGYNFQGGDISNVCLKINDTLLNSLNLKEINYDTNKVLHSIRIIDDKTVHSAINSYSHDKLNFDKDYLCEGDKNAR